MSTSFDMIHAAINDRINNPNALNYPEPWWRKEIEVLTSDLDTAICFIQRECTDEELFWMSEIFDDMIQKTRSAELLTSLGKRVEDVQDEKQRAEIINCIEEASLLLKT